MPTRTLLILCTLCTLLLLACGRGDNTNTNTGGTETAKPAATTSTASSTGTKIGVPECDDFIAKYDACVSSKVPEAARATYANAVKQWRESWKKLAENPQTKGTLAAACKQAAEQQAAALKQYGCAW